MNLTLAIGYLMMLGLGTYLLNRLIEWGQQAWRTRGPPRLRDL